MKGGRKERRKDGRKQVREGEKIKGRETQGFCVKPSEMIKAIMEFYLF